MQAPAERERLRMGAVCTLMLAVAAGCAADSPEPVVGSGHVIESATDADVVQKVAVSLPFEAEVGNGEPKKLVLRGEDNLLEEITVEETAVGEWRISAPQDLAFTQHEPMQIAIPYVDMVKLSLDGDDIVLTDHPSDFWHQNDADQEASDGQ